MRSVRRSFAVSGKFIFKVPAVRAGEDLEFLGFGSAFERFEKVFTASHHLRRQVPEG